MRQYPYTEQMPKLGMAYTTARRNDRPSRVEINMPVLNYPIRVGGGEEYYIFSPAYAGVRITEYDLRLLANPVQD